MIKKLTIAVAILAVLIFVAVLYFKRSMGPSDAAVLIPTDTVLFVSFPDLPRTILRWRGTALAKIGDEPEMKAFLEKPLARVQADAGANEAGSLLSGLKPGNIFLAVTNLTPSDADVLVGFQFWGGRGDFDQAVARLRKQLSGSEPVTAKISHAGTEVLVSDHGPNKLYSTAVGRWGLITTDEALIKGTIDRISGSAAGENLAANARFKTVLSKLPSAPDALFFLQPERVLDTLLAVGQGLGAQAIPAQIESLRSTQAVGGVWKIDGTIQRDAIFTLRETTGTIPESTHAALKLTTTDTVLFGDLLVRNEAISALITALQPMISTSPETVALAQLATEAYGPEIGIVANWPTGQSTPTGFVTLQIRDAAKASEFLNRSLALVPGAAPFQENGTQMYSIPAFGNPLAAPTLAQTDKMLLLGLDPAVVAAAVNRPPDTPTLATTEAFRSVSSSFDSANEIFAYVDTAAFFERAYTTLRPVVIFSASVMPGVSEFIDTTKLPQTDTITRHLPPMVFSQRMMPDGTLVESSGPITLNQAGLAMLLGTGTLGPGLLPR